MHSAVRHFALNNPLFVQEYKWIPVNSNKMTKSGEGGSWTNIPSEGGGGGEDKVAILMSLDAT